jgi:hypothetical protein
METEITVTLFALGGTVLGTLIGAGVSVWITKQQLSLSFQQHKLEILQGQIAHLQNALDQISEVSTDVKDQNLTSDQIHSRLADTFLRHAGLFLTFSHLFPREIEEKVTGLSSEINQFIYHAKIGQPIDNAAARIAVEKMPVIDKEIFMLLRQRLRMLQSEVDKMTTSFG